MSPDWSSYLAPSEEIRGYLQKVVEHYGLKDFISYGTTIVQAEWDEESGSWQVETSSGETISCTHLVSGCGALRKPVIAKIKGLENFKGKYFHSAQWDQSYDYKDKRVALIGTGASAVQIGPAMIDDVKKLHVFQRTPVWAFPR